MSSSDNTLMLAILALDSYNRGYNRQLNVRGNTIGSAAVKAFDEASGYVAAGITGITGT